MERGVKGLFPQLQVLKAYCFCCWDDIVKYSTRQSCFVGNEPCLLCSTGLPSSLPTRSRPAPCREGLEDGALQLLPYCRWICPVLTAPYPHLPLIQSMRVFLKELSNCAVKKSIVEWLKKSKQSRTTQKPRHAGCSCMPWGSVQVMITETLLGPDSPSSSRLFWGFMMSLFLSSCAHATFQ